MSCIRCLAILVVSLAFPAFAVINTNVTPITDTSCTRLVNGVAVGDKNCDGQAPVVTPPGGSATYLVASSQNLTANAGQTLTVVAPAVVHFDGSGFVSAQGAAFSRIRHRFDFGDTGQSGSGSWDYPSGVAASERLKNQWVGLGITAHMYEDPGTYYVQHKVRDTNGAETTSALLTIVVQDPDTVYASSTMCIFRATGLGQGSPPTGCITHNADTGWPIWSSDARYLLRAGEDFSGVGDLALSGGIHRILISRYGAGADPITGTIYTGYASPDTPSEIDWPTAVTFIDIDAQRLMHRNVTNSHSFIRGQIHTSTYIGSAIGWWVASPPPEVAAAYTHNKFTAYVDTHIVGNAADQKSTIFGTAYAPILLGTRVGTPTAGEPEHTIRMFQSYKGVYQHLRLDRPHTDGGRCNIRIQSNGTSSLDPNTFAGNEWSQFNSIERSEIHGGTNVPFGLWLAPENDTSPQRVRDIGAYNNVFLSWAVGTEIATGGEDIAYGNDNSYNRTPIIITGHKINGGIPNGPYYANESLVDPSAF